MAERRVYYMALSNGYRQTNTITNKVDLATLRDETSVVDVQQVLQDLLEKGTSAASAWGIGESKSGQYREMSVDDVIFFTYKETIVYVGTIIGKLEDVKLSQFLWSKRGQWPYQIILDDVIQVFIPGEMTNRTRLEKHFPEMDQKKLTRVLNLLEKGNGARRILNITNDGNMQGVVSVKNSSFSDTLLRFSNYCFRTNFECVIKKI